MGMSPLKVSLFAASALAITDVSGAERDICNPDVVEDVANELLHTDMAEWPTDELISYGAEGINAVAEELLDNWNIRTRDAERVLEQLGGRRPNFDKADADVEKKVPMIKPVIDELKLNGISDASLKNAWQHAGTIMADYNKDARELLAKLAVGAPALDCPA